jgi:hypothetical protein
MRKFLVCVLPRVFAPLLVLAALSVGCESQTFQLKNAKLTATFGPRGLVAIADEDVGEKVEFAQDEFALRVDDASIRSADLHPSVEKQEAQVVYHFKEAAYAIDAVYELRSGWRFVTKRIELAASPVPTYKLRKIEPLLVTLREAIEGEFTPRTYLPQFGPPRPALALEFPTGQYGTFLRLKDNRGVMLAVQNPFLTVARSRQQTSIDYEPQMMWQNAWGSWSSDAAVIGLYRQSGRRIPATMTYEWQLPMKAGAEDGADLNEIQAYTECVREFVLPHPSDPISVEVGWTLNDYQIDVATEEGRAEYKRVMDTASELRLETLLYAPANHELALRENDVDDWNWEHVLWLGLGQQIRKGEWDVETSPIPRTVSEMLDYAKSKHLGILAYVYPSLPFVQNPAWIVRDPGKKEKNAYANLGSREFQDFLIHELIAFKRRTGIAGYSFDYAFLNVPGSSTYSQWRGWRRVMEALREAEPDIVIDGRQTYQSYGPWSWLAGNYPHPTGNDEQAESFLPYPDLHFDRVSADRMRFVNYWYRNYEFAPHEVVPGYMTHQTPRERNVTATKGASPKRITETVYTSFRQRDWDYLGYQYSVLSSIATAGWNNVMDMIPGRDPSESEHFSEADKSWIREWIAWAVKHKELLKQTRTILGQPAMGRVDGTAAVAGDHGFLFLFNPNYKTLSAEIRWGATTGLSEDARFVLRELYPEKGKLLGNPGVGVWKYGDTLSLTLEGTSATVLELVPASELEGNILVFGLHPLGSQNLRTTLNGGVLNIDGTVGKIGSKEEISVLLPGEQRITQIEINGKAVKFSQHGRYVSSAIAFRGAPFSHSQEVSLHSSADGSLTGTFTVPSRIQKQLAKRHELWPIPWTEEDYLTTWLVPERLLLFVQVAEPRDSMQVSAEMDGSPLTLTAAYSSVREASRCLVGWYADLSRISVDQPHTIRLTLPKLEPGRFQGLFFDNVEDEHTDELAP